MFYVISTILVLYILSCVFTYKALRKWTLVTGRELEVRDVFGMFIPIVNLIMGIAAYIGSKELTIPEWFFRVNYRDRE